MTCSLRIRGALLLFALACAIPLRSDSEEVRLPQHNGSGGLPLSAGGTIPWQTFGQGEYVGPARSVHVPEYLLRVDDEIEFIYRLTRDELGHGYQLEVGDVIRVESVIDAALTRELPVQPDGTIDLLYLGPVRVGRRTVEEVAKDLNQRYTKYYKVTDINVT